MIDVRQARQRLESVAELPKEQRRAALEKLATDVNELMLAVGCTASATVDVVRGVKSVAVEVQSALIRARRR